ncbi:ribulokinase [Cerasicoccus arenae]|uniref:Ribulokinase n=1 Tax=Cerasicoccus arenae TaxID=424488 RepID=A0A8J3GC86_9BACT|nr:ribulokinase [Cerasicoccus arenae]MBK1858106.1 ribulokinase [Cerasicoccus arenae]GHB96506.1 ribulokinase [Cerasicoccus arenae]
MAYTLGIDYGTNSVRAVVVRCLDGAEIGEGVLHYPSGKEGILLDPHDANLARQHPGDYLEGLESSVRQAIERAKKADPLFSAKSVVGIGVDTTGSSPLPVDEANAPLALNPKFRDNLNAQCWLWKDHTSHEEAARITALSKEHRPQFVARTGDTYSSEWWWSKIWHCLNVDPEVFDAAHSWVELSDFIPSVLSGITDPLKIQRSVCAAGHKALYAPEWDGLPDKEFLAMLNPKLADLRHRLYEKALNSDATAGHLCDDWAHRLGLPTGIPIAMGLMDVHYGAIACGVKPGTLVKVIGTSTCDCAVMPADQEIKEIPGICGIVNGSIIPGCYGVEAGQSAVGDIFKWWVEGVCQGSPSLHVKLTQEATKQHPGQHGLLALDWNNGNRTVLVDQRLTGLLLGQTLHTTQADIYRALIEATAFGARKIIERMEAYGVRIDCVVCAGGIAEKNPLLMQIYADVLGREMQITASSQACALGAAIGASVVAGVHTDYASAQAVMAHIRPQSYQPIEANRAIYNEIYALYEKVHDAFGGVSVVNLGNVMKELLRIKDGKPTMKTCDSKPESVDAAPVSNYILNFE